MKTRQLAIWPREYALFAGGSTVSARVPEVPRRPRRRGPEEVYPQSLEHHRKPHGFDPPTPQMLHPGKPVEGRHRRLDTGSVPVAVLERRRLLRGASAGQPQIALRIAEPVPVPYRLDRALHFPFAPQTTFVGEYHGAPLPFAPEENRGMALRTRHNRPVVGEGEVRNGYLRFVSFPHHRGDDLHAHLRRGLDVLVAAVKRVRQHLGRREPALRRTLDRRKQGGGIACV